MYIYDTFFTLPVLLYISHATFTHIQDDPFSQSSVLMKASTWHWTWSVTMGKPSHSHENSLLIFL